MCHPGIMHRGFRRAFYQAWTTVWVAGNWASTDKIVNELIFAMKKWEKVNLIVIQLILELDLTNLSCVSVFVDACSVQSCHWGDFQEGFIKLVEALSKTPGRVFACCVAQGGHCCPGCPGRTLRFTWVSDVMTLRWRRSPKLAQLHLQYKRWWRRFQCVVLLYFKRIPKGQFSRHQPQVPPSWFCPIILFYFQRTTIWDKKGQYLQFSDKNSVQFRITF